MILRCVVLLFAAAAATLLAGDVATGQFKKVEEKKAFEKVAPVKPVAPAGTGNADVGKEEAAVPTDLVEVRFTNGSVVVMTMLQEKIEIVTDYGRLIVPPRDIRQIEFGIHATNEERHKIETAIKHLGSNAHDERETAVQDLVAMGPLAYLRLQAAVKTPSDLEVSRRAEATLKTIREKYPARLLRPREEDMVRTGKFSIVGRIITPTLKARADDFGDLDLRLSRLLAVRWVAGDTKKEVSIDAATFGGPGNSKWKATGIRLEPRVGMRVTAVGEVNLLGGQGGQRMVGPDGQSGGFGLKARARVFNPGFNNGQQGGELMGRIGDAGTPFFIGSRHTAMPKTGGQLFLMIQQSPWGCTSAGEYRVTVVTGPMVDDSEADD